MAIGAYLQFTTYNGACLDSDYQVDVSDMARQTLGKGLLKGKLFELEDYSINIEQTLNIGSQSSGAGAGKVSFRSFEITRKVDRATPILFQNACSGTPFKFVTFVRLKSAGGGHNTSPIYLRYDFKLVAVKTISWTEDDESPKEIVVFEFGGLVVQYGPQLPDGSIKSVVTGGWNRLKNVADTHPDIEIR